MKRERGMILVAVLIVMQLFLLCGLTGLLISRTLLKRIHSSLISDELRYQLIAKMTLLETTQPSCLVPAMDPNSLAIKSDEWWRSIGCPLVNKDYQAYFVVESLGNDECGIINEGLISHYYRLTLFALPTKMNNAKIILQSTYVVPTQQSQECTETRHPIKVGRQILREL